jgi:hypothetical protein
VFLRVKLPVRNATDALASFIEFVHRGEHNRFGSLANGPFRGTGAGCAAFAMSWLQAAGAIPFITEPPAPSATNPAEELGPTEFWRAIRARLHIPWRLVGCDERVGAARVFPAQLTVYDLLFHRETGRFVRAASEGLAERIRASYGSVAATLFQIGALTPLRDLVIDARRKDPNDRGDYTWSGPGIDIDYWDNARFSSWIHRLWANGPRDPRIRLAREVSTPPPYAVDASAQALHNRQFVADLHADTLLSARDPATAASYGQLDLPRLRAGHVGIQVFSIVTNMPRCPSYDGCERSPNLVALLAAAQGWPIGTWADDQARALYQAAKLRRVAADPEAGLALLENADDLARLLSQPPGARPVGAVLAVEGAQAVGDDMADVDALANAGVRMLGLAHFLQCGCGVGARAYAWRAHPIWPAGGAACARARHDHRPGPRLGRLHRRFPGRLERRAVRRVAHRIALSLRE